MSKNQKHLFILDGSRSSLSIPSASFRATRVCFEQLLPSCLEIESLAHLFFGDHLPTRSPASANLPLASASGNRMRRLGFSRNKERVYILLALARVRLK